MNVKILYSPSALVKFINSIFLVVGMSIFFAFFHQGYAFFIGSMIISAFTFTLFILLTYFLGGERIQKTFFEVLINAYFAIMLFSASIVGFTHSTLGGTMVATAIFCLLSFVMFCIDIYYSLINMGAFERSASQAQEPSPPPIPTPMPQGSPFSPDTPAQGSTFPPMPSQMDSSQGMYSYSNPTAVR